jgi:hypothetical protein
MTLKEDKKNYKSPWAIKQTAKGVGEATVRRIMAEYNKNKKTIPDVPAKARGKPEYVVPQGVLPIVREYIRSQNLKGLHVSVDLVRNYLAQSNLNSDFVNFIKNPGIFWTLFISGHNLLQFLTTSY